MKSLNQELYAELAYSLKTHERNSDTNEYCTLSTNNSIERSVLSLLRASKHFLFTFLLFTCSLQHLVKHLSTRIPWHYYIHSPVRHMWVT